MGLTHSFSLNLQCNSILQIRRSMINRELIRLRVVQLAYAYNIKSGATWSTAEKELDLSFNRSYELYVYMLTLLREMYSLAQVHLEAQRIRAARFPGRDEYAVSPALEALAHNQCLAQLSECSALLTAEGEHLRRRNKHQDETELNLIGRLFDQVLASNTLRTAGQKQERTYDSDRSMVRALYREVFKASEPLAEYLEEMDVYWNDDRFVVDSFVDKTLKQMNPALREEQPILPAFDTKEDRTFAFNLFEQLHLNRDYLNGLIAAHAKGWTFDRLAVMDVSIAQAALTELIYTDVPVGVTFNKYLDIAHVYSTPDSAFFLNGLLDAALNTLREERKVLKS